MLVATEQTFIWVTFQKEGIHCYPMAKDIPGVEFLASPHRHMFHFKVKIEVFHDDREIEFILFKRELETLYSNGVLELNHKSCEMIAKDLMKYLDSTYGNLTRMRNVEIDVSEDNENGATLRGIINGA